MFKIDGLNTALNHTIIKLLGGPDFTCAHDSTENESDNILRDEVDTAVNILNKGKSAGVDNIPRELVQAGGEDMISILHKKCNKILKTGEWTQNWTQSS